MRIVILGPDARFGLSRATVQNEKAAENSNAWTDEKRTEAAFSRRRESLWLRVRRTRRRPEQSDIILVEAAVRLPSYIFSLHDVGEWLSLVEHLVRDQGVGGSNPLSPTILFYNLQPHTRLKLHHL